MRENRPNKRDPVYVRNFGRGPLWLPGHIVHSTDYVSFQIELLDGRTCRRHIDRVRTRFDTEENTTQYDADFPLIDNATWTNLTAERYEPIDFQEGKM